MSYAAQPFPAPMPVQNDPYRGRTTGAGFSPISATPRKLYLALVILSTFLFFACVFGFVGAAIAADEYGRPNEVVMMLTSFSFLFVILLLYGQIGVGLYWLYKTWEWLPFDQRYTKHWRSWITPGQAALLMIVPYFHYYWMFVINCGLCDAIDRLRVQYPTREAAPKGLAIAACVCQLVIPLPVGAIMWLIFMRKIERMTQEMSGANVPRMPYAA